MFGGGGEWVTIPTSPDGPRCARDTGVVGRAAVPSGASTGEYEVCDTGPPMHSVAPTCHSEPLG